MLPSGWLGLDTTFGEYRAPLSAWPTGPAPCSLAPPLAGSSHVLREGNSQYEKSFQKQAKKEANTLKDSLRIHRLLVMWRA
jgi:hypothetical protein